MNSQIRVKVCGITNLEDAQMCVNLGVDALGFVFYGNSKRAITPPQAQAIIEKLPPFVTTVGLFVNAKASEVSAVLQSTALQLLQFHGDETAEYCAQFNRPYMKAISVKGNEDFGSVEKNFASAVALLYDSYSKNEFGGTGTSFNWHTIPSNLKKPWVLAGGLNPNNIAAALEISNAVNVDVSSGVEAEYGIKDPVKLKAFLSAIKGVVRS